LFLNPVVLKMNLVVNQFIMSRILIVYSSTSGNTKKVVDAVADLVGKSEHQIDVKKADQITTEEAATFDICVLASPTYAKGMLHYLMAGFMKEFRDLKLKNKPCAVIALGDIEWGKEHHIAAAGLLEADIKKAGGRLILPTLKIDGPVEPYLKGEVLKWVEELLKTLSS